MIISSQTLSIDLARGTQDPARIRFARDLVQYELTKLAGRLEHVLAVHLSDVDNRVVLACKECNARAAIAKAEGRS